MELMRRNCLWTFCSHNKTSRPEGCFDLPPISRSSSSASHSIQANTMCRFSLSVRSPAGELGIVNLNHSKKKQKTVRDLKKKTLKLFPEKGYITAEIQLVVAGKPLDDDSASLSDYGIKPSSVVQMVTKVNGG